MEGKYGDPTAALDYVTVAVRGYHDSGNAVLIRTPLVVVTVLFDRLGRHEPADTIAGFASDHPLAVAVVPEIETAIAHLHEVLGTPAYESLARDGEKMMTAEMVRIRIRPNRPGPNRTGRRLSLGQHAENEHLAVKERLRFPLAQPRTRTGPGAVQQAVPEADVGQPLRLKPASTSWPTWVKPCR